MTFKHFTLKTDSGALATLCVGGGMATATIIERI